MSKIKRVEETRLADLEADSKASLDSRDSRTNSDKEEEINKGLETYLRSLRNSLEDRKAKDLADQDEDLANRNKAKISF